MSDFATLNFLHLMHIKYGLSYSALGKILKVHKMTIYRFLNADRLTPATEFRIKKNIALWLSEFQKDFLDSYRSKT